ncbi:hypothetical protein SUGI_1002150 [Cryptomeria japonica]|nr:hypothetical protein SUGI_1002150 [Cryptomeria japonica]
MDSLELSLFTPDFTITSFYKVFGSDPTGLGCLFIKDSVLGCLQNKENTGTGMVSIIHVSPQYLSDSGERRDDTVQESDGTNEIGEDGYGSEFSIRPHLPAFSGAFSSAQQYHLYHKILLRLSWFLNAQTSCLKGNTKPLQDDIKKATSKKSREIDTRESVYNGQGKSHADQDPSKPNGNSFSHGSSQGDNLPLEDEMGISRRVDSQRFPKPTWITFNLDGEGSVSAGYEIDDNRDKGGSHTSEQSMSIAEEVVQSVSSEISSCDKDDKQFMEHPFHAKQNIVNATTSLARSKRAWKENFGRSIMGDERWGMDLGSYYPASSWIVNF